MMQRDGERLLFWLMPFLALTWLAVFFVFPNFSDPLSPAASADEVAAFYRDPANTTRIRITMIVFNWFAIGIVPFLALIVMQIRRMAHRTPILSYCYLGCLTGGPTLFFIADLFWLLAAFRPERDPGMIQMFNDIAWISFTGQVGFLVGQCLFLAMAIFLDRQERPVFPGWLAWFNILIAIAIAPAAFTALALTGPIAWDGLLSFYVRNTAIGLWIVVMILVMGRNILSDRFAGQAA